MRFAQIDGGGLVLKVVVADSLEWVVENIGGNWVETFKDGTRFNFAGIGYTYDSTRDAFIPPKPHESWVLVEESCLWVPPVPMPEDGDYTWNEGTQSWDPVSEA